MSIKTIDLSAAWVRYANADVATNEFRLGWRTVTTPFVHEVRYNSWIKFDTSQLTTLNIKSWQIITATIRIFVSSPVPQAIPTAEHRVIRNATTSLNWTKYDGTNNWAETGGQGLGTDIVSVAIANHSFSGTQNDISISAANLFDIYSADRPVMFWTNINAPKDNYISTGLANLSLRVTYRHSGLAGDATIF